MLASCLTVLATFVATAAAAIEPLPPKVEPRLPDAIDVLSPSAIHIQGWLGTRIDANIGQRLLRVDTEPLLAGYRKKPGSHPWIGEHIGKWMHAATLAWAYTGDPRLREKLDRVAAELVRCQEPDGYLGTYVPERRFGLFPESDWDVWSHKYNLIGLMTYYQYTGDPAALGACRKMVDLLIATFPAKRSILAAGTHVGMAATSVLEPIVLVYRATGDERYLKFAQYIVKAWDEPGGPKIAATLLSVKQVDKTANGKAYEMLSNLVGVCELARATGDRRLLQVAVNAWQDIVAKRLYITGSASYGEVFHGDYDLPNSPDHNIGETCVTTTWIQLNLQLLRLTGEAKYGDEIERSLYNHLAAAQHPRGDDWCYYTALEGRKPYDQGITCCHSSGPRGMALAPQTAYFLGHDVDRPMVARIHERTVYLRGRTENDDMLFVSTFESSRAVLELGGQAVTVEQASEFPQQGRSIITIRSAKETSFGIKIRIPSWAVPATVVVAGQKSDANAAGWTSLPIRTWKSGEQIEIDFHLGPRLIAGEHGNAGRAALAWGPFILACDQDHNPGLPAGDSLGLIDAKPLLTLKEGPDLDFAGRVVGRKGAPSQSAVFVPFADAGAKGGEYRIWLRAAGSMANPSAGAAK